MPNVNRILSAYIQGGNPDTMAIDIPAAGTPGVFAPYAPGEVGGSFDYNDKTYEIVKLDSGATSATAIGAVAANQLAFWKSKTDRIVTNDIPQCLSPSSPASSVAGIFRRAVTTPGAGGTLVAILCRGAGITVAAGTTAIGAVMADATAGTARVVTATGIFTHLGISRTVDAANVVTMDVDIPTLP